ncbi:MAG: hypothetical protein ACRDC4_15105, partial [Plesiomonas sp.]
HELRMKREEVRAQQGIVVVNEESNPQVQAAPQAPVHTQVPNSNEHNGSDSSILGTVAAVGAGALAGYAVSGLLDNGYRTYSDGSGRTRYLDSNNREISRAQYEDYRAANPTSTKLSDANQKGKELVKTGQQKTMQASQLVKEKTLGVVKSTSKTQASQTPSKPSRPVSKPSSRK